MMWVVWEGNVGTDSGQMGSLGGPIGVGRVARTEGVMVKAGKVAAKGLRYNRERGASCQVAVN
jgi:hypothetical protein